MNPGFLRRALRWLGWTVLGFVALLAAALLYYRFDEPLTPQAQALLDTPLKLGEVSDDNGYVALIGIGAPPGEDPMAWGRDTVTAYRAGGAPKSQPMKSQGNWCFAGKDCATRFKARAPELAKLVQEEKELLSRYRMARGKPKYEEAYVPTRYDSPLPNYSVLINGSGLVRFTVFTRVAAGDVAGALAEMEQEIAFHRRVLGGSRTLIGNAVAARALANDALVLSELMRANRAAMAPHAARIGRMLDGAEGSLDLRPALQTEMRLAAHLLKDPWLGAQSWSAEKLLYRPNMTVNTMVDFESRKLAALAGDATGYDKARTIVEEMSQRQSHPGWLAYARNPVGALLVAAGGFNFQDYVARMHDTAALIALVRTQAAVLERRARKPGEIEALLSADGGKRFADPYSGKPFAFDAGSGSLWFTARMRSGGWQGELARRPDLRVAITP